MRLFQKPSIQRLPFPIPGCSLSCSTVGAYTDNHMELCFLYTTFFSHPTPGCEGCRQDPCWHHWPSGQHKGWGKTEHTQTHAFQHTSPFVFLEIQPQNCSISQLQWPHSCTFTLNKVLSSLLFAVTSLTPAALVRAWCWQHQGQGSDPSMAIPLRAGLSDACGCLPTQDILWHFDINITVWLILLALLWKL